jgi:hypothetical protein
MAEHDLRAVLRAMVMRGVNRAAVVMRNNLTQMCAWAEKAPAVAPAPGRWDSDGPDRDREDLDILPALKDGDSYGAAR